MSQDPSCSGPSHPSRCEKQGQTHSGDVPFDDLLAACECLPEYDNFVAEAARIQRRQAKSASDVRRMRQKLQMQMGRALSLSLADAELAEALEPLSADHLAGGSKGSTATDSVDV